MRCVDCCDCLQYGDSSLQVAIDQHNNDLISVLLRGGASPNTSIPSCGTVLHWAVAKRKEDLLSLLVELGADANLVDKTGATPLHLAATFYSKELFAQLLRGGSNPNLPYITNISEEKLRRGGTMLHWAVEKGQGLKEDRIIELLLQYGVVDGVRVRASADINAVNEVTFCACMCNVRVDQDGETAVHSAAVTNQVDVIQLLIRNLANPNAPFKVISIS